MGNGWKRRLAAGALAMGISAMGLMNAAAAESGFLIDVRTPQEFDRGHLLGSINIDYQEIIAKIGEVTADRNAKIELYCRSGRRSGIAEKSLKEAGYQNAVNIGGFEALRQTRAATQ